MNWLWVALGGGLGSVSRYAVSVWMQRYTNGMSVFGLAVPAQFPLATLSVNVVGSFIIGAVWVWLQSRSPAFSEQARLLLMVGVLGGFTTFSAFSLETLQMLVAGQLARALAYLGLSLVLCVFGAWLGMTLMRGVLNA